MTDTVIQIVRDTVYIKGADALDILTKTNEFYDSSWNKLITMLAVTGVLLPLAAAYYQRLQTRLAARGLENRLRRENEINGERLRENLAKEVNVVLEQNMRFHDVRMKGASMYLQAAINETRKAYENAFIDLVRASHYFIAAKEFQNAIVSIEHAIHIVKFITKDGIAKILPISSKDAKMEDLIADLQKNELDNAGAVINKILELQASYATVPQTISNQNTPK